MRLKKKGLSFERHLVADLRDSFSAEQHEEYEGFFKVLGKRIRKIPKHTFVHQSVKNRYEALSIYRPESLERFVKKYGWINLIE